MGYSLRIDDARQFKGAVLDQDGAAVYQIHGWELLQHGVMRAPDDLAGLAQHLWRLRVIPFREEIAPA